MQTDSPSSSSYVDIQARAIQAQFTTRPTLRSVVAQMLGDLITEKTAPLDTDIALISVAIPNALQGYDLNPLVDVALNYMAGGDAADFSKTVGDRASYLVSKRGTRVRYASLADDHRPLVPDMQFIENILLELPSIVQIGFQQALTDYWNAPADTGASRWQWLGDQLRYALRSATILQAGDDIEQREILTQLANHPSAQGRAIPSAPQGQVHAYCIETTVTKGALSITFQAPDILVVRGPRVLLCSVSGAIKPYASMEDFGVAWGKMITQRFNVETITWKCYEPNGDIFDIQAALLLNQQLEDIAAFELPARLNKRELEQRFNEVTDAAALFCGITPASPHQLRLVQAALPEWLRQASVVDQLAYRKHSLELASLNQATKGRSWADGIDDIRTFAANALQQQMLKDQPLAPVYKADELELTFHVPVGNLGSGYIERVKMTLTDLALKNLAGRPKGRMTLRHTGEGTLQDWMTSEYLSNLITRVDIGRTYPQLIKNLLLSGSADADRRQRQFAAELQVVLPMKALEHSIKREHGLTRRGYQLVSALMHPTYADRVIDGQEVVIRPLAFSRKTDAPADVVGNMFIIEYEDSHTGPHVLYRPIYTESLLEYPTREALFAAIASPGTLQRSVLAWLPEKARAIYDNGGFNEPHITHFSQLDPFGLPEKPKTATLANGERADELMQSLRNGTLMQYLFGSEARALVDQGERDSVSDAESRWAILLEGGWTLFNTLLALPLGGPILAVGWMISMVSSLLNDLPQLDSQDPATREVAWIDFLMNISMLLLHGAQKPESPAEPVALKGLEKTAVALDRIRRPANQPLDTHADVKQGTIGLPSEPPGGGTTLLDFDRSQARDSSATRLLDRLREVNVKWPDVIPEPIQIGAFKGLYRIDHQWHASIAGLLFQVNIVPGFGEVYIVHPSKSGHPGIKLKTNGQGHWTLDQGLKLTGGGPKKRIAALQKENLRRLEELYLEKQPAQQRQLECIENFHQAAREVDIAQSVHEQHIKKLQLIWKLLEHADDIQKSALRSRQVTELAKTASAWSAVLAKLEAMQASAIEVEQTRRQLIDFSRRESEFNKTNTPAIQRAKLFAAIASTQLLVQDHAIRLSQDYLIGCTEGEPLDHLANRFEAALDAGDPLPYRKYIQALENGYAFEEHVREWTRRFESTLNEMQTDSHAGARERNDLLKAANSSELLNELNIKLHDLDILRELSVDRSVRAPLSFEDFYSTQTPLKRLKDTAMAHLVLRTSEGFTFEQRQAVLETIIEQYQKTEDASQMLKELGPAFNRPIYQQRFVDDLRLARQGAESDLAELILEQENLPVAIPRTRLTNPQSTTKRIFKTRNHGTLIGELQAPRPGEEGEIIEVHDPFNKQMVARYHKHVGEDVYVQVVEQPRQPAPVTRSVKTIMEAANKLLAQRVKLEALIDREMAQVLRDPVLREEKTPADWETMLVQSAGDLEGLVNELQKTTESSPQKTALLDELVGVAQSMRTKGRDYRIAGYKLQSPTPEKVDYLWTHHTIDIEPVTSRELTQAKDFLSEFAIKDKHSREVLWYAHFHYARLDGPTDAYTAGHLKKPEQRFVGFKAQLSQAKNNREITRIWRSKISPAMAKKLFFYD
ncbi:hypothetical protein BK659_06980 [Pseudomonas brassicacearum]|uniref:Dermonecrotic toxin N-terminal domain-containing protein n=1 Tax=Pseudomonas brassicacearum TaxID=930166 RepID=A0A423H8Z3_9PSED|nr:DUF6543 domain-containing protein [Pseudomonas brassicacearum]RON09668.1 hypothetical protein BK659_06980 [Pseudomonas brassicacearum]